MWQTILSRCVPHDDSKPPAHALKTDAPVLQKLIIEEIPMPKLGDTATRKTEPMFHLAIPQEFLSRLLQNIALAPWQAACGNLRNRHLQQDLTPKLAVACNPLARDSVLNFKSLMIGAMADHLECEIHAGVDLGDFNRWMASEQKRIFLLCRRLLQDPDEAGSATQDVFLKAYKALRKGRDELELDNPGKWVTRIAVNTCLDRLRSKSWNIWRRRPSAEDESVILQMEPGGEPDAERQVFAKQIQRRLEAALGKLSERQRAVFSLRHYDAMSLEEISDVLKLDIGTVKAHLFRAVTKMREQLKDLYGAQG